MKVSIIIPAYNEEKYLRHTLEAVLAQTYSDIEIIVVDNASTDGTAALARQFPSVRVFEEKRQGPQFARERGFKESTGDIVCNLDADCAPDRGWVARAVSHFKNLEVVGVSGPWDYADGGFFFRYITLGIQCALYPLVHFFVHHVFHRGAIVHGGNFFARRSALEKAGGYDTSVIFYGDDTSTGMRLTGQGKMLYLPSLAVVSSARRFKRLGTLKTSWNYIINFVWVTLFKRPFHPETLE